MQQDDTHPDYQAAAPGRQTTTQTTTPDYHIRVCSRTRRGVAAHLRYVSHKQQEDNAYAAGRYSSYKSYKKTLQKLQNLTKFVKF